MLMHWYQRRSKKNGEEILEGGNGENWIREVGYTGRDYGGGVVGQWSNGVGDEL